MIKIDDNYSIRSDSQQWILEFKGEPVTKMHIGEVKEVTPNDKWYYPSISACLKKYLNESLKSVSVLDDILGRIDEVENKIDSLEFPKRK